jgi:hypothetical protein
VRSVLQMELGWNSVSGVLSCVHEISDILVLAMSHIGCGNRRWAESRSARGARFQGPNVDVLEAYVSEQKRFICHFCHNLPLQGLGRAKPSFTMPRQLRGHSTFLAAVHIGLFARGLTPATWPSTRSHRAAPPASLLLMQKP